MATQYKAVRIPDDIISFVESQPGKDFSKKLVGILCAYRDMLEKTQHSNDYNEIINEIERLAVKLRKANNKLADTVNRTLADEQQTYQISLFD